MIFRDVIQHAVDAYGESVAITCKKQAGLTHLDVDRASNALAARFREAGLEKGDKIALYMGNCHHYREMFWAAGKAGFVLVPVNWRLRPREVLHIINDSEAKALVVGAAYAPVVEEIRSELSNVRRFYSVDPGVEGCEHLGASAKYDSAGDPWVKLAEDDLLWFQYTSGTTGLPKGRC
jgi:acyl-CoA synthetase (AMP-forming)/AMP-acid ligase II